MPTSEPPRQLIEKIRSLPKDKIAEVEDFVDFLRMRNEERMLASSMTKLAEKAFDKVWNNPEDAEYDKL